MSPSVNSIGGRITLQGLGGRIEVVPDERMWCSVRLVTAGRTLEPGSQTWDDIAVHLGEFLREAPNEWTCVLAFSELHFCVYGEAAEAGVLLRFQDRYAVFVAELHMAALQTGEWGRVLAESRPGCLTSA